MGGGGFTGAQPESSHSDNAQVPLHCLLLPGFPDAGDQESLIVESLPWKSKSFCAFFLPC